MLPPDGSLAGSYVAYESTEGILFSADAFGTFGAINGNIYADEVNVERDWLDDYRRYYTNIVGNTAFRQAVLKKAAGLDIRMICPASWPDLEREYWLAPLKNIQRWSSYTPKKMP